MKGKGFPAVWVAALAGAVVYLSPPAFAQSLEEQNQALFRQLEEAHGLSAAQREALEGIFSRSGYAGQGNPAVSRHPLSPRG